MELGTFGIILKFALDLEGTASSFYESAAKNAVDSNLVSLFENLLNRGQKRIKTLKRIRRENTTEMILEPITGFSSDSYDLVTAIPEDNDERTIREIAATIEEVLHDFYTVAATKIDFLSEAAYSFEILAEENDETRQLLAVS